MSISFIHFGPSDLFMMVSFMYSLNVDVILQILLPIIWILPLITLASTLREFQCDSSDPHCKYLHFLIDHIRHQASVKLQIILPTGSSRECQCCFSNSPPQGSIIPLFPSISVLLRASKCSSSKCFPKNLHNCIDRAGRHIQFWNLLKPGRGCYIQESDLSVVVIKVAHFDFLCDQRQCALSNSSSGGLHTATHHILFHC